MAEPTSTAGTALLLKLFGAPAVATAASTAIGFAFVPPKSKRELFLRFFVTLLSSFFIGPLAVLATQAWMPGMFEAAKSIALDSTGDGSLGIVFVSAPILVLTSLPAWFILAAVYRWLEKCQGKDIAEIATDAAAAVKQVKDSV